MSTPPIAPLTRPAVLGDGTIVTWPYRAEITAANVAIITVPVERVRDLLEGTGLSPVRVLPGRGGLLLVHVAYAAEASATTTVTGTDEPVEEILFYLPTWRGPGGSVPGVAWLLHGTFNRQIAGYGLHPLFCIAGSSLLARVRREVWGIESAVARIRSTARPHGAAIQVDSDRGLVLRADLHVPTRRSRTQTLGVPLHLMSAAGPRQDWGEMEFSQTRRRYRPSGSVELTGRGPLAAIAEVLGTEDLDDGTRGDLAARRRPLATLTASGGHIWFAGPRPLDDQTAVTSA